MQHSDKNQVNFISQVDGATGCFAAAMIVTVTVKQFTRCTVYRKKSFFRQRHNSNNNNKNNA